MNPYQFSPEAEADLVEIITYIAAGHPAAARKLVGDIRNACAKLAAMPTLGHRRNDLTSDPDVLFFCIRSHYLVIYRKNSDHLQIARVLHGARGISAELEKA